jgi:hypothetical protein
VAYDIACPIVSARLGERQAAVVVKPAIVQLELREVQACSQEAPSALFGEARRRGGLGGEDHRGHECKHDDAMMCRVHTTEYVKHDSSTMRSIMLQQNLFR